MIEQTNWQSSALKLLKTGVLSQRQIAKSLKVPRSTLGDFVRGYKGVMGVGDNPRAKENVSHLVIPDTQCRPGISLDYLRWIGEYIVRKRPSTVIHLGDHADMPSLSGWDKGKMAAEGTRVQEDINAAIDGMSALLEPLSRLQEQQEAAGEVVYKPRMVLLYGNHEDRITRYVNDNPSLHGFLGVEDLQYEQFGWETVPFLTPIEIDGISYCHYFPNVMTGKALTGTAQNMLKTLGKSFTMGHRQLLDVSHRQLQVNGDRQWGLIAGAAYVHNESYKGHQGNKHWRGIIMKHNVSNGGYDPMFVSMEWLEKEFGNK